MATDDLRDPKAGARRGAHFKTAGDDVPSAVGKHAAPARPAAAHDEAPAAPAASAPSHAPAPSHAAPRTRESLEGAVAGALDVDEQRIADLASGRAEGMDPSVRRAARIRDKFQASFEDELEPASAASAKAAGTAHLQGAAAEPATAPDGDASEAPADVYHSDAPVRKRRRRRVPLAAKVLIALLVVLLAVAGGIWAWVASLEGAMSIDEEDRAELEDALVAPSQEQGEATYMLIIGSDAREGDTVSRSDVIMLARVDEDDAAVTLVSIPRDTMVTSPSGQLEKINAAYNYGPASTVRAVSEFAGVDISHYVEVDFDGLKEVVDALGGVTVDIPEDIVAGNGGMSLSAGVQVLDGEQALAYARERYNVSGGDFGRAQAQRQIVEAIVREVLASSPMEIPGLVSQLAQSISTDLSVPDIASYALEIQRAGSPLQVYSAAAPSYALNQGGVSYVATMYDEWREMMQRVDAGLDPSDETAQVPEEQLQDERLGSATNAAGPRDYRALADGSALTTDDVAH